MHFTPTFHFLSTFSWELHCNLITGGWFYIYFNPLLPFAFLKNLSFVCNPTYRYSTSLFLRRLPEQGLLLGSWSPLGCRLSPWGFPPLLELPSALSLTWEPCFGHFYALSSFWWSIHFISFPRKGASEAKLLAPTMFENVFISLIPHEQLENRSEITVFLQNLEEKSPLSSSSHFRCFQAWRHSGPWLCVRSPAVLIGNWGVRCVTLWTVHGHGLWGRLLGPVSLETPALQFWDVFLVYFFDFFTSS